MGDEYAITGNDTVDILLYTVILAVVGAGVVGVTGIVLGVCSIWCFVIGAISFPIVSYLAMISVYLAE